MDNPSLKLQEIMGTYYPNFLEIYVNTDKAVVLHKLSKKELGTFFHEWIHFIQDITTSFGCYNAYVYFESFLSLGKKAMEERMEFLVLFHWTTVQMYLPIAIC